MIIGGVIADLVLMLIGLALDWNDSLRAAIPVVVPVWGAFILLASVVALIGSFTIRFELVGTAISSRQPTR